MFSGFKINITEKNYDYFINSYYETGKVFLESKKTQVYDELDSYINQHDRLGTIDGSKLQEDWFKQLSLDIFISHSHTDEKLAISIAGWLYQEFNLTAFVDSCIWGYANDLLNKMNYKYNVVNLTSSGTTFSYDGCNYAASHVHMMLCTALNKMIDRCESVFFLNTKNSLVTYVETEKTRSPWIYSEICLANTIRRRVPKRNNDYLLHEEHMVKNIYASEMAIEYDVDFSDFVCLSFDNLEDWFSKKSLLNHPLDSLYKLTGLLKDKYR